MDLEHRDLAVLEERLYSSIHHSYQAPQAATDETPLPAPSARVVSRTSVINNGPGILPANMKRYWAGAAAPSPSERAPYHQKNKPNDAAKQSTPSEPTQASDNEPVTAPGGTSGNRKMFLTPYQSLLGLTNARSGENSPSAQSDTAAQSTLPEEPTVARKMAPKESGLNLKKKKQTKQSSQTVVTALEKKLESLSKLINKDRKEAAVQVLDTKKAKANKLRNNRKRPPTIVAQITLNSSDDESQQEAPKPKASSPVPLLMSDGEADEVIIVPAPSPPKICIDCSDEEDSQTTFALPKSKKSKKKKTVKSSPRCLSPSNSSIMSDDFIGQHDRSRLNDSFTEPIPNDDELECSMEGSHRSGTSMTKKNTSECRQERVPSISSEDTICTSGDTTDQERRPHDAATQKTVPPLPNDKAPGAKSKKKLKEGVEKSSSKAKGSKSAGPASPMESSVAANDTEASGKTPSKSKARSKSPVTLMMDLIRKQFEPKKSGKKAKSKKETEKTPIAADPPNQSKEAPTTSSVKNRADSSAGGKEGKAKKSSLSLVEQNVSSESDYDLSPLNSPTKASTPHRGDKRSASADVSRVGKRAASSTFIDKIIGDVSSESDYDESLLQTKQPVSAKETKKRVGRKRKQYNSETYSDEDFACLLTDIVRAVSDTDDDDDDEEEDDDEDTTIVQNEVEEGATKDTATTKQASKEARVERERQQRDIGTPDVRPKKKKKIKEVSGTTTDHEQGDLQKTPKADDTVAEPLKKKKKLKAAKSLAKQLASGSTTPDVVEVEAEEVTNRKPKQSLSMKKNSTATADSNNASTSSFVETVNGSDSDDAGVTIVEESFRKAGGEVASKSPTKPKVVGADCAWNEEMRLFYNDTEADEDFNLKTVLNNMPRDRRQWHIVHKDLYPDPPKREVICNICDEPGHMKYKCRNKPKTPICYMCGEPGHREPRCPNTICLNCGAKTRSFVRDCRMCTRDAGVVCFICRGRGHTQRSCPDLWRRYHSTIEDNVPLKEKYERNPKARWCCICCRYGHQAHSCNDATRIFGHAIPDTNVNSYLPAYRSEFNRSRMHQVQAQQKRIAEDPTAQYNLFSDDANDCELNLDEVIQNEKGFYYRFVKMTGLLERQNQQHLSQALMYEEGQSHQDETMTEEPKLSNLTAAPREEPEATNLKMAREEEKIVNESRGSKEDINKSTANSSNTTVIAAIVEENSNYSFSEFHATDTQHVADAHVVEPPSKGKPSESVERQLENSPAADFIPLASVPSEQETPPVAAAIVADPKPIEAADVDGKARSEMAVVPVVEQPADARVFLSKENAKLLLSPKGNEFLNEAGKQHNVKLSITFESVGNVLLISGLPELQDNFHQELIRFLNPAAVDDANAKYFQNSGPRISSKMVSYISQHLRFLEANCNVSELLVAYQQLNPESNASAYEKCRRKLNIQLFGVYGLREGRKHLNVLRHQLSLCAKGNQWKHPLSQKQRTIIDDAIRYIFSAYDHKDYVEIVKEYEIMRESHQLRMLTYNDLGFTPQGKNRNATAAAKKKNKNAVPPNNVSKKLQIDVNICNSKKFYDEEPTPYSGEDDFVLNTYDQMIDPMRLQQLEDTTRNVGYDEQWGNECHNGNDRAYEDPMQHGSGLPQSSHSPLPHSNWTRYEQNDWVDPGYRTPRSRGRSYSMRSRNQHGNAGAGGSGGGGGDNAAYYDFVRLNERENVLRDQEWQQLQKLQQMLQR